MRVTIEDLRLGTVSVLRTDAMLAASVVTQPRVGLGSHAASAGTPGVF